MAPNSRSCSICMDSFGDPNDICSTNCGHIFHYSCFVEWQERSNTCPLCNRSNPAPHRIYIDLNDSASPNNEAEVNKIIIKNIPPNLLKEPFSEVVLELARCMNVSMGEHDIGNVYKIQNSLEVTFKMARQMEIFLSNKYKLKSNEQTSMIGVHEALDVETKKLFDHAHQLKNVGYTVFFVREKKVYVKKTKTSPEIHISSMGQVDTLSKDLRTSSDERPQIHRTSLYGATSTSRPTTTTQSSNRRESGATPSTKFTTRTTDQEIPNISRPAGPHPTNKEYRHPRTERPNYVIPDHSNENRPLFLRPDRECCNFNTKYIVYLIICCIVIATACYVITIVSWHPWYSLAVVLLLAFCIRCWFVQRR